MSQLKSRTAGQTLGEQLQALRTKRGLTLVAVAHRAGLDELTIAAVERDTGLWTSAVQVAAALGGYQIQIVMPGRKRKAMLDVAVLSGLDIGTTYAIARHCYSPANSGINPRLGNLLEVLEILGGEVRVIL